MTREYCLIDKTRPLEEMLETSSGICLCGMPGLGKKTMIRMLLERHPEVAPRVCALKDLLLPETEKPEGKTACWYLVQNLSETGTAGAVERLRSFFFHLRGEDRLFLMTDGEIPGELLEFVWNGSLSLVYPDSFWFTRAETARYLRACRSPLDPEQTYDFTRGWAGLLALLVRIQKQMTEVWTPRELYSRYEVRRYIADRILKRLPEEEREILLRCASFPRMDRELAALLWQEPQQDAEERLFMRGLLLYQPGRASWFVHPAIRREFPERADREQRLTALRWYEDRGLQREALECCLGADDPRELRNFLIRNFRSAAWLPGSLETVLETADLQTPELFYLKWMELYFKQENRLLRQYTERLEHSLAEAERQGGASAKWREVFLNITYLRPDIRLKTWLEYLEQYSRPGEKICLYNLLGESVSFLSGLRDLTELFACGAGEKNRQEKLWRERLDPMARMAYRLAEMEYAFLTDRVHSGSEELRGLLDEIGEESHWQLRMGKLYLMFLLSEGGEVSSQNRDQCEKLWQSLVGEEDVICRYNGMALYYLTEARWGRKEDIIRWVKDTGGDLSNRRGKTRMHLAAQVKVQMYLGNYAQAGRLLEDLMPYFEKNCIWRFRAEALFQKALCERELGRAQESVRWMAESLQEAEPYRYVRIYTGYGKKGREMLEAYRQVLESGDTRMTHGKRPYKYGNVRNMPYRDWLDYIIRKARKNERNSAMDQEIRTAEFRVEKLTVTERMILQYLGGGYSNQEIGREMNVKISTVKSHIYSIYKKLGVSSRIQAVQKGREEGLL